jgi:hypothetical protein
MPTIVDYLTGPLVILIEPQCLIARSAACKKDDLLLGLSDPCEARGGFAGDESITFFTASRRASREKGFWRKLDIRSCSALNEMALGS